MRKTGIILVVGLAMVMVTSLSWADIAGSKHDLSSGGSSTFKGTSDQVCIYCHTPHNANADKLIPLWNKTTTATDSFTLYSSSSLQATPGQPAGVSKACLSCHDGSLAVDSYGVGVGAVTGSKLITGASRSLIGTDLSNDHPVSFTYNPALVTADGGGLHDPTTLTEVRLFGTGADQMECSSCHNVHATTGVSMFLRMNNAGSAMCLKCHNK